MFLKLTELTFDLYPPIENEIFIQSNSILFMRRSSVYMPDQFATTLYLGGNNYWPKIKESPEEIIRMIEEANYDAQGTNKSS
jgi:hypothetical protein